MNASSSTAVSDISIVEVHTPHTSFAIAHSFVQDTLQSLFSKLDKKYYVGSLSEEHSIGPGWLKYEWNDSVWNLDDGASLLVFLLLSLTFYLERRQRLQYICMAPAIVEDLRACHRIRRSPLMRDAHAQPL